MDENWELMKEGLKGTPTLEAWLTSSVPSGGNVGIDARLISAGLLSMFQVLFYYKNTFEDNQKF